MKVSPFAKLGLVLGAVAVSATCLVASPANATDQPSTGFGQLVGLGSDTTQDVMGAVAAAINTAAGSNLIASYDATGPSQSDPLTVLTRSGQVSADATLRAGGSGDGYKLLKYGTGYTASDPGAKDVNGHTLALTQNNTVGKIDFARASSAQGTADPNGAFTDIPFAKDAVTVAFKSSGPLSLVPSFSVGSNTDPAASTASTPLSLYNVYHCTTTYIYKNADGTYAGAGNTSSGYPSGGSAVRIVPTLPKAGSGTRKFFVGLWTGQTEATFNSTNSCVDSYWNSSTGAASNSSSDSTIIEHDGTAIAGITSISGDTSGDTVAALGIYSIPQYVAQSRSSAGTNPVGCSTSATDHTAGVSLGSITPAGGGSAVAPTTGTFGTCGYATNSAFPVNRLVYNIVPTRLAQDASSAIHAMFVGTGSLVCGQSSVISQYGFIPLTDSSGANACGDTSLTYDVNTASVVGDSTFGALSSSSVASGGSVTSTVTIGTSNFNQGGSVKVYDDNGTPSDVSDDVLVGSASVASNATSAVVTITPTEVGARTLHAYFVPTLAGIAVKDLNTQNVTVTESTTTQISVKSTATLGSTVRVVAWVNSISQPAGTVVLKDNGVALTDATATTTIAAGENAAVLTYVAKTLSQSITATFTPTDSSIGASTSSSHGVTVPQATATLAATRGTTIWTAGPTSAYFASIRRTLTSSPQVRVTLSSPAGAPKPTGTVRVYLSSIQGVAAGSAIGSATISNGAAIVTLNHVNTWAGVVGDKYLVVRYTGDTLYAASSNLSKKIKVTN